MSKTIEGALNTNWKLWLSMGVLLLISLAAFALIVWLFRIFLYVFGAIILLSIIRPFICRLEDIGFSRIKALIMVFASMIGIFILGIYLLFPVVSQEAKTINDEFPNFVDKLDQNFIEVRDGGIYLISPFEIKFDESVIDSWRERMLGYIRSVLSASLTIIFAVFIIIPLLAVIMALEGRRIKTLAFSLVPNSYFEVFLAISEGINKTLSNFIYAKAIQTLVISIVCSIGFLLIGLKAAILLGILAGLLNIIPYLGPIISMVPIFAVGLVFGDFTTALLGIFILGLAQLIDNLLIQPVILPKLLDNHPLTVILATLIGAQLFGPVGMILGILVFSIFKVIFIRVYSGLDTLYSRNIEKI